MRGLMSPISFRRGEGEAVLGENTTTGEDAKNPSSPQSISHKMGELMVSTQRQRDNRQYSIMVFMKTWLNGF